MKTHHFCIESREASLRLTSAVKMSANLLSLSLVLASVTLTNTLSAQCLELNFQPGNAAEATRQKELELSLRARVTALATSRRLNTQQQDVVYKTAVGKELCRYRSFAGYTFDNRDIEALEELVGAEARSKRRDLKIDDFETAGLSKYVGAEMNSLLVRMYVARAKALFGSDDAKYWVLSPEDRNRSSSKTYSVK